MATGDTSTGQDDSDGVSLGVNADRSHPADELKRMFHFAARNKIPDSCLPSLLMVTAIGTLSGKVAFWSAVWCVKLAVIGRLRASGSAAARGKIVIADESNRQRGEGLGGCAAAKTLAPFYGAPDWPRRSM